MAALTRITNAATVPDLWDNAFKALKEKDKQSVDFQRTNKRAILEDLLVEVQEKKQDCLTRRLKHKRSNGDSVHIYDVCEKIVKWVNTFKEVGDAAVQYDPGHAALPWAAIRFFLQVAVNDVQIFGNLVEGLEVVSKTVAHYAAIEENYLRQPSSVNSMLQDSMIAAYTSILRYLSKCRRYFDLGHTQRVAKSIVQLPETSAKKHLDRIAEIDTWVTKWTRTIDAERLQSTLTQQSTASNGINRLVHDFGALRMESTNSASKFEALLTSFTEPMIRTVHQVSTLSDSLAAIRNESQLREDRRAILKWISDVQYRTHHQTLSNGLLEGTGTWLLKKREYVEWRNSSVSSILWLHGIPGSGKTHLVANVVKQLLAERSTYENAAPIAYFYCERNTADLQRSNPTEVMRAILKQLVLCKVRWESESSTAKAYKIRREKAEDDGSEIERLNISETTKNIIKAVAEMPVTIIIDALDECHPDQRHQLLRALEDLLENSAHLVKVFISSRDDVDIVLKLQDHPNIYINIDDNKQDINRFIHSEIEKAQIDGRLLKGMLSSKLKNTITTNLATKAGGMFLWVNLQIQNLCDSRRIKVEEDLLQELTKLPKGLAGMYSVILGNISQIGQHGRNVAETALKWLLCTKDSSSETIIAACSAEDLTERLTISIHDVLDVCCNLVVYDEALDRFRFAHLSVQEFLESQPGYTSSEANQSIAMLLLQNLMSTKPEDSHTIRRYAISSWTYHYQRIEGQRRKQFFEHFAKQFFFNGAETSEAYDTWTTSFGRLQDDTLAISHEQDGLNIPEDIIISPVLLACYSGWVEVLEHYEEYQSSDCFSASATDIMNLAIRYGSVSVVRWLLARNFRPTSEQIKLAFDLRQSDILQFLLDEDSVSCSIMVFGQDYLLRAVCPELKDIYQVLIEKGANFKHNGDTLLFRALEISSEDSEILEDLLLKGLDPLPQGYHGRTPLSLSIMGIYQHIYALSTAFWYDSMVMTDGEQIMRRVLGSHEYRTACLLVRYGTDSMMRDVNIRAQWMSILDSIAMFPTLQSNYSVSGSTRSGNPARDPDDALQAVSQTLLSLAALYRHEISFRVLLGWGTNPTCPAIREAQKRANTVTQMGDSMSKQQNEGHEHKRHRNKTIDELRQGPLAWAAYTGDSSLVQSILDQGMDPNIRNRRGQAPLYFAAQQVESKYSRVDLEADKEEIVRLLLQKGAVVTSADAYGGATVLAEAFLARYSEMAHMLIEHGAQIPKGAIGGPMKQIWVTFDRGREEVRKALNERFRAARAASLDFQPRIPSGDPVGVAAQLMLGGTMRVLGNAILEACGDINDASQ